MVSFVGEPMSAAEGTRLCTWTRSPSLASLTYYDLLPTSLAYFLLLNIVLRFYHASLSLSLFLFPSHPLLSNAPYLAKKENSDARKCQASSSTSCSSQGEKNPSSLVPRLNPSLLASRIFPPSYINNVHASNILLCYLSCDIDSMVSLLCIIVSFVLSFFFFFFLIIIIIIIIINSSFVFFFLALSISRSRCSTAETGAPSLSLFSVPFSKFTVDKEECGRYTYHIHIIAVWFYRRNFSRASSVEKKLAYVNFRTHTRIPHQLTSLSASFTLVNSRSSPRLFFFFFS